MTGLMARCVKERQLVLHPEIALGGWACILVSASGAAQTGLHPVAAGVLGLVHGRVGGMQDFLALSCGISGGDAEAQADVYARSAYHDAASGDVAAHALGEF